MMIAPNIMPMIVSMPAIMRPGHPLSEPLMIS